MILTGRGSGVTLNHAYEIVQSVRLVFHDGRLDFIEPHCTFAGVDGSCFRVSYRVGGLDSCTMRHRFWPLVEIREAEVTADVRWPNTEEG